MITYSKVDRREIDDNPGRIFITYESSTMFYYAYDFTRPWKYSEDADYCTVHICDDL